MNGDKVYVETPAHLIVTDRMGHHIDPELPAVPLLSRADRAVRYDALVELGRTLLTLLGEDPERAGLRHTPERWARWWLDFIDYEDGNTSTSFEDASTDQMIVVRGIRVWSLCEHHLLPFWCDLTMGYIPTGRILGLSKFGRLARLHAHRLNVQEGLVQRLAEHLAQVTGSPHIAVLADGEHLCMTMRGARSPHRMSTSVLKGAFRADASARQEFFHLARARP